MQNPDNSSSAGADENLDHQGNADSVIDDQLAAFQAKIQQKCEKYRVAVQKDKLKQKTLLSGLETDFGSTVNVAEAMLTVRMEAQEHEPEPAE